VCSQSGVVVVTERDNRRVTYLSDTEERRLVEFADEADESVSRVMRDAIREYTDLDRAARVEDKIRDLDEKMDRVVGLLEDGGTHTHKDDDRSDDRVTKGSPAVEKARRIHRRLVNNHEEVIKSDNVERAIEDIAGADDRTLRKYKGIFRDRGLLFEHPGDRPLWTTETDIWADWVIQYGNLNGGRDAVEEILTDYPATVHETADGPQIEVTVDE